MPKWTKPEDIARIKRAKERVKPRLDEIRVGEPVDMPPPLEVVDYGVGYCVRLENGELYSVKGKPVILSKEHAEWFSYRLRPDQPAASFRAIGPDSVAHTEKDIFNSDIEIPPRVYVVSPGPNGADHFRKIPDDAFVIATNKAIEAPIKTNLWLSCEPGVKLTPWFQRNIEANKHLGCFWSKYLYKDYPDIPYTCEYGPPLRPHSFECIPGVLRSRATIASEAFQMAYMLGAKEIILCGVDIMGNKYFDFTSAGEDRPELNWKWVLPLFNPLIRWVEAQGVKVFTMSETALDVEWL